MLGGPAKTQVPTNQELISVFRMLHCFPCASRGHQPLSEGAPSKHFCAIVQLSGGLHAAGTTSLLVGDILPQCWQSVKQLQPHVVHLRRCSASRCRLLQHLPPCCHLQGAALPPCLAVTSQGTDVAAGTGGFCKVWCAGWNSMHAACALRCPVACMAPTSAGAAKSSRWTTAATATTWKVRCQWVLLPQDAEWAKQGGLPAILHQALCLTASGAAHLQAGVSAVPAHSAASSQLPSAAPWLPSVGPA